MLKHQLVRGIADPLIQEQILAQAATTAGANMKLDEVINLIEAKESGKADAAGLSKTEEASSFNCISEYRSGKVSNRIASKEEPKSSSGNNSSTDIENCTWCAKPGHGNLADKKVRENLSIA
jgi:hypothetical protein